MRRIVLALAALAAAPSLAVNASAQAATPHREAVLRQLQAATDRAAAEGFSVATGVLNQRALIGMLPRDGSVVLELHLRAGTEYVVTAGCDADCDDLDLRAFAPGGQSVLDEDVAADDLPIVTFTPTASGPHPLAIVMSGCKAELCYFGLRVLARTPAAVRR